MIREVDLITYMPQVMAEYKEIQECFIGENPEFTLIWRAADSVLNNEFIATADEYGIQQFETMLGIYPEVGDDLEARRSRVKNRWFTFLPYTWQTLNEKLVAVCGEGRFSVTNDFSDGGYTVTLVTNLDGIGEVTDLAATLADMLPANIVLVWTNEIIVAPETMVLKAGGGIVSNECIVIA